MSGLFWLDEAAPKKRGKYQVKLAIERFWEKPEYLPGLDAALRFDGVEFLTDDELIALKGNDSMSLDIECYPNYFLVALCANETGKVVYFEHFEGQIFPESQKRKLRWILENIQIVTFNGLHYDFPMLELFFAGLTTRELKECSDDIIANGIQPHFVLRARRVRHSIRCDHIDIKNIPKGKKSLKMYAASMHVKRMQDLPFAPETVLSLNQIAIVRHYCCNDLRVTSRMFEVLHAELILRVDISKEYGIDLRSKSDAQMAEALFRSEMSRILGYEVKPPNIEPGTKYKYKIPSWAKFRTPELQKLLEDLRDSDFTVYETAKGKLKIGAPQWVEDEPHFALAGNVYTFGLGGLHSNEKSTAFVASDTLRLIDADVGSYYPNLIRTLGLYPAHIGPQFCPFYAQLIDRRMKAKETKQTKIANTLKILLNGTFGKLGDMFSILFSPDLLLQVTISGQLALLMLIEAFHIEDIHVAQANTDGVVCVCPESKADVRERIYAWWQKATGLELEFTEYSALYSRDVNCYMAIKKKDGSVKGKNEYSNPWGEDISFSEPCLAKRPETQIIPLAMEKYLSEGIDPATYIRSVKDLRHFVTAGKIDGGVVVGNEYLGRSVRWYYGKNKNSAPWIVVSTSAKVPDTDGAIPCMQLPDEFPEDLNHDFYIVRTWNYLVGVAAVTREFADQKIMEAVVYC